MIAHQFIPSNSFMFSSLKGVSLKDIQKSSLYNNYLWTPISECINTYSDFAKLVGTKTVLTYVGIPFFSTIIFSNLLYSLNVQTTLLGDTITANFLKLGETNDVSQDEIWNSFTNELIDFSKMTFYTTALQTILDTVVEQCQMRLSKNVQSVIDKKIYSDQSLIAISKDNNNKPIFIGQDNDSKYLIEDSSYVLVSAAESVVRGAQGVYHLLAMNWTISLFILAYSLFNHTVSNFLANKTKGYMNTLHKSGTDLNSHISHALNNSRGIVETKGEKYIESNLNKKRQNIYELNDKIFWWNKINSFWSTASMYSNGIVRFFLLGYNLKIGKVKASDRASVEIAIRGINKIVNWTSTNLDTITRISNYKDRLSTVYSTLDNNANRPRFLHTIYDGSSESFKIEDLTLKTKNSKIILNSLNLKFDAGKYYAIQGATGMGKSTFLAKLMGIDADDIIATGKITYPVSSKAEIIMIPQQDFFPLDKSLLDTISYPALPSENDAKKIKILLKRSGLEDLVDRLDEVSDFSKNISGGQRKMLKIIGAIIKNPKILLLDETLTGLDPDTSETIQTLIKEHLPNTTIIVVDHTIKHNNRKIDGKPFYDEVLTFNNKTIVKEEINLGQSL